MVIFIPLWGITGAAISIAIATLANNLMRYIFLYRKFNMQPFTLKYLLVPVAFGVAYVLCSLLNQLQLIPDIFIRSIVFTTVFGGLILLFRVSNDFDNIKNKLLRR